MANLKTLLELSEFAKNDPSIIESHKEQGIHTQLQSEHNELCCILGYANAAGHTDAIDGIRDDILKIQNAIKVYW